MKSRRTKIIASILTTLFVGVLALAPHFAHASVASWFLPTIDQGVNSVLAFLFNNILLPLANMFLQLTGFLLNASMNITLHMNTLVSASGGIVDSTWSVIRDVSSILIIFFLLYTAIEIIIGISDSKVQHLIVMVAIAGVLINFSLFFTKLAVDGSNIISLALYRAITPTGSAEYNGTGAYLSTAINDGGLSNVFMNALQIQKVYSPVSNAAGTAGVNTSPIAVITAGAGGVAIMWIAGLSFLSAAILFTVRIALLIILMAFSPFYFLGMIIPKVKKEVSDLWWNTLVGQCLIMPIYLLFMYIAMRVITNPTFKSAIDPATVAANVSSSFVGASVLGTVMQYVISIILISVPLIAAMKYASVGKDWANAAAKNVGSFIRKNTFERGVSALNNSEFMKNRYTNNPNIGRFVSKQLSGVSGGYEGDVKANLKADAAMRKKLGEVDRSNFAPGDEGDRAFKAAQAGGLARQRTFVNELRDKTLFSKLLFETSSNRKSSYALEKDMKKDENSAELKTSIAKSKENSESVAKWEAEMAAATDSTVRDQLEAKVVAAKKENEALQKRIDKIKKESKDETATKLAKMLEEKDEDEKPKTDKPADEKK